MAKADVGKDGELVPPPTAEDPIVVDLAIGGMTCSACVRTITDAVSELEGVSEISVNQVGKCARAVVTQASLVDAVVTTIEDLGYEAQVVSIISSASSRAPRRGAAKREIALEFRGAKSTPDDIADSVQRVDASLTVLNSRPNDPPNVIRLSYAPNPPDFTIRALISSLSSKTSPSTAISVYHPPSTDELARKRYHKEQRSLLIRLLVAILISIPIFVIGIVYMSLVRESNPVRRYLQSGAWSGEVPRGEWILFILATPIMFYSASEFHRRSLQELRALWKPGSRTPLITRFTRFGSMNLLISLGVSVAYFSSVAEVAIAARSKSSSADTVSSDGPKTYFDSVAFLTMFLLIGRYIEAFSKHQAANAITLLGELRNSDALLVTREILSSTPSLEKLDFDVDEKDEKIMELALPAPTLRVTQISTDLLEVGDIVRVPSGASPPADGVIISSETTLFDESSLTGESRDVEKCEGDHVFVGTINKLRPIDMKVEAVDEGTMLEQVIDAVRQGQAKRAPVEKIVDVVTSYFVPVVTALAIITWVTWLGLGLSGRLPADTLSGSVGGWAFWSLEFAIAVFVIACPCGIGLAAPTALLVGSGLAAKHGILARGGGEAFQEASQIDVIIFDKTGTLTEGSEPKVTDVIIHPAPRLAALTSGDNAIWDSTISGIVLQLASASSHPLCIALREHFSVYASPSWAGTEISEVPGCGIQGTFSITNSQQRVLRAMMGNDAWLTEHGAEIGSSDHQQLRQLRQEGKSVVLLAVASESSSSFKLVAFFAVADPIRPEAPAVLAHLQAQGIETWMISGDNEVTARAVAASVGIPSDNVIAGVLPNQKAEKVLWLQTLPRLRHGRTWYGQKTTTELNRRIVAMVGDGINDAPALTSADVGIAMGSGSDIALSSADFVLLSSNLRGVLVLAHLSKKVFRRIRFNFAWATVYNLITIPIAAGAIFPAHHSRLSPVWSSLTMALSSTSVVCSSLLLRLYKEPAFKDVGESATSNKEKIFNQC